MNKTISFILLVALIVLSGCQSQFDKKQAESKALSFIPNGNEEWYISSTRSEAGQWVVRLHSYENECEMKLIYFSKRNGYLTDQRGGNECQS